MKFRSFRDVRTPLGYVLGGLLCSFSCRGAPPAEVASSPSAPAKFARVQVLTETTRAPHRHGAKGDLVLLGSEGTSLVVAERADAAGTLPLRGAIIDIVGSTYVQDALFFWRPGTQDASGVVEPCLGERFETIACASGEGIAVFGHAGAAACETRMCALPGGRFEALANVTQVPAGKRRIEQVNPGSSSVTVAGHGSEWEGEVLAPSLSLVEEDTALVFEGAPMRARRNLVHITSYTFPGQVLLESEGAVIHRSFNVLERSERAPADPALTAQLHVDVTAGSREVLPAHILVRGVGASKTPHVLSLGDGVCKNVIVAGPSVHAVNGCADLKLVPGEYEVVVTHGPTHSLHVSRHRLEPGTLRRLSVNLTRMVDTSGFVSADFHLHAAPSPDAAVSLEARVASLTSVGVELGVATDHNAITDYAPAAKRMNQDTRLSTVVGDEITSIGAKNWGHFNAFPLTAGDSPYRDRMPQYYETLPKQMFDSARALGAQFIQVNHPRMDPQIGYFDQVHFNRQTGQADPEFDTSFQMLEAFNGFFISQPEKVREGVLDALALVKRGMHPVLTGNSDSHKLYFEAAGYPRTYVYVGEAPFEGGANRSERVFEGLRKGATTVSSGPFIDMRVNGQLPGRAVKAERTVRVSLRVQAADWVPAEEVLLYIGERQVSIPPLTPRKANGALDARAEFDVTVAPGDVLYAWVRSAKPLPYVLAQDNAQSTAFTGFFYVQ
jgi:hypothetical protein